MVLWVRNLGTTSWVLWLRVSNKATIRWQLLLQSPFGRTGIGSVSRLPWWLPAGCNCWEPVVGVTWGPAGYWLEPLSVPCLVVPHEWCGPPCMTACFIRANRWEGASRSVRKRSVTVFYNLTLRVTFINFALFCLLEASCSVQATHRG